MKLSLKAVALTSILAIAGCGVFTSLRPATAAARLAFCDETSLTRASFTSCCLDVAKDYPLTDGGARDAASCYATEGGK